MPRSELFPSSASLTAPSPAGAPERRREGRDEGDHRYSVGEIRAALAKLARPSASPNWGSIPFQDDRLDSCFPAGGLQRGRWHEIVGAGSERELPAAAAGFAASLAARCAGRDGAILWILQRDDLYAPGLIGFGIDPERLIFIQAGKDDEALSAMEGALRTRGVAAVVGEVSGLSLTAGKRLQLACEQGGAVGLLLRRRLYGVRKGEPREQASAATTRWSIGPAPSAEGLEPGLAAPCWSVRLTRNRGGRTGGWILEADDATGDVRVVAELADHASSTSDGSPPTGAPGRARHHGDGGQRATAGGG